MRHTTGKRLLTIFSWGASVCVVVCNIKVICRRSLTVAYYHCGYVLTRFEIIYHSKPGYQLRYSLQYKIARPPVLLLPDVLTEFVVKFIHNKSTTRQSDIKPRISAGYTYDPEVSGAFGVLLTLAFRQYRSSVYHVILRYINVLDFNLLCSIYDNPM